MRTDVIVAGAGAAGLAAIAVDRTGRRFANEANSYHRFGEALSRLPAPDAEAGPYAPVAWPIADARALRRYGLGLARPALVFAWLAAVHLAEEEVP